MSLRFTTREITNFQVTDNTTGDQAQFTESQILTTQPQATAQTANATWLA